MTIVSINPATGETLKAYQEMTPAEVERIIASVHGAFGQWRKTTFAQRAGLMKKAASILRDKASEYAQLMTQEMGKPIRDGRAEAEKCAWVCDYYADNAEAFLQPEPVVTDASNSFITYQPLGVVLAVMP